MRIYARIARAICRRPACGAFTCLHRPTRSDCGPTPVRPGCHSTRRGRSCLSLFRDIVADLLDEIEARVGVTIRPQPPRAAADDPRQLTKSKRSDASRPSRARVASVALALMRAKITLDGPGCRGSAGGGVVSVVSEVSGFALRPLFCPRQLAFRAGRFQGFRKGRTRPRVKGAQRRITRLH